MTAAPRRPGIRCVADHAASAATAKNAATKYSPASFVVSARHAITARTANNAANGSSGEAVAGSMRTITGNTKSRTGAAYAARAPSPENGRRRRSAASGASAKKPANTTVNATAMRQALVVYDVASQMAK